MAFGISDLPRVERSMRGGGKRIISVRGMTVLGLQGILERAPLGSVPFKGMDANHEEVNFATAQRMLNRSSSQLKHIGIYEDGVEPTTLFSFLSKAGRYEMHVGLRELDPRIGNPQFSENLFSVIMGRLCDPSYVLRFDILGALRRKDSLDPEKALMSDQEKALLTVAYIRHHAKIFDEVTGDISKTAKFVGSIAKDYVTTTNFHNPEFHCDKWYYIAMTAMTLYPTNVSLQVKLMMESLTWFNQSTSGLPTETAMSWIANNMVVNPNGTIAVR